VDEANLRERQHHADLISGLPVEPQCGLGQLVALIGIAKEVQVPAEETRCIRLRPDIADGAGGG
jgi:hypothetical protein